MARSVAPSAHGPEQLVVKVGFITVTRVITVILLILGHLLSNHSLPAHAARPPVKQSSKVLEEGPSPPPPAQHGD